MQTILRRSLAAALLFHAALAAAQDLLPYHQLETSASPPPVPWAQPLAGGPIRVLAVAPYSTFGDLAGLQGHIALELETVALWDPTHLGFDSRYPEPQFPDAAYDVVVDRLSNALDRKKLDVIVLGQCDPSAFPEDLQQRIIDRVNNGTGLLITGQGLPHEGLLAGWFHELPAPDGLPDLTHGVGPLGIPQSAREQLISCRTAGSGRVASVAFQHAPSPNHALLPIPDNPYELVPEIEANAFSLSCKLLLWAAGRDSEVEISHLEDIAPKGPDDEEIPPGYPPEFIEAARASAYNNPIRPYLLHLRAPAPESLEVSYQVRIPGASLPPGTVQIENSVLPRGATTYALDIIATPGEYLLDVWLRNRKGVVAWHTDTITVTGWPRVSKLAILHDGKDAVWLQPNDYLDVQIDIPPVGFATSGQEATLHARAVDSFNRHVANASQIVGPDGGHFSLRLELADLIAPLIRVEVFAVPNVMATEATLVSQAARSITYFPVRLPVPAAEPVVVLSSPGPFDYGALRNMTQLRERLGANALHAPLGVESLLASSSAGLNRIAQVGSLDGGSVSAGDVRAPCLSAASYQTNESERIRNGILEAWAGGAPLYSLGSGCALTDTEANVCQSPDCLNRFHEYLQQTYPGIDALNEAWNTAYVQWDEVLPQPLDQCQQSRRWAPWLDFRLAMNEVLTGALAQGRNAANAVDGSGLAGFQAAAGPVTPVTGYDWRRLCATVDFIAAPPEASVLRRMHAYHAARPYSGVLLDHTALTGAPGQMRWLAWSSLLNQLPALWLDQPFSRGPRSLISPAGTLRPDLAEWADTLNTIQLGVGALVLQAEPRKPGIAFVDSPASRYLDYADPEPGRTADEAESWLDQTLNEMGFAATVRTLPESLEGINTLILSRTRALSNHDLDALKRFHEQGGLILSDGRAGTFDGHGTPRGGTPLPYLHPLDPDFPDDAFALWTNRPVWVSQAGENAGNQDILRHLLGRAGNIPAPPIDLPEKLRGAVARYTYTYGAATLVACLPESGIETSLRRASMAIPEDHTGINLLNPEEQAPRNRLQWTVTPGVPAIFSILPYRVKELRVHVPETAAAGQRLTISASMDTGDAVPGAHFAQITIRDPFGKELRHYRQWRRMDLGTLTTFIPLATNETPGRYTVTVSDVLTRTTQDTIVQVL